MAEHQAGPDAGLIALAPIFQLLEPVVCDFLQEPHYLHNHIINVVVHSAAWNTSAYVRFAYAKELCAALLTPDFDAEY